MKVELYLDGEFKERWYYDDIRTDGYSEEAVKNCNERLEALIADLKSEILVELEGKVYYFFIIYQSKLNFRSYSEADIIKFNEEVNKAS